MTTLEFIVYCMATWRISSLLVNEAGPFDVFVKIREAFGIKHNEKIPYEYPETFFAQLLSCVWCVSIWVAAFIVLLWLVIPGVVLILSLPLALSAGAILIDGQKA
jgi:hypothetical protein